MNSPKRVLQVFQGNDSHWVGEGFSVRTIFSYQSLGETISPFLLLDYAGPRAFTWRQTMSVYIKTMKTSLLSIGAVGSRILAETLRRGCEITVIACIGATLLALPSVANAEDNGIPVDLTPYADRPLLPDFTASPDSNNPQGLTQINGNLYRHTTGPGLAVHSGLVLVTTEGAVIIDPAMTRSATWLLNEIKTRFKVPVKYVIYTHAHADHISGGQVFQQDGAVIVANQRALEPIVGEKIPTALPNRVFDTDMKITLGEETVLLHRVAPSHSDSMIMVLFPKYKALQCTDVGESHSMPYNDFLDFYYDGWIETLDWVLAQDVEIIDVGHYTPATKADIRAERAYMIDLHQQVLDLARKGQSWDELYRNVRFNDEVKKWIGFDQMHTLNILGMYRWVSNHRRGVW